MAAKVVLKHRQLHLKINQTIFLYRISGNYKKFTCTNGLFVCKAHACTTKRMQKGALF